MRIRIILVVTISLYLLGCTSYDYSRQVVSQGNLLPKSDLNRLKLGMTKEDAAILMGTSLMSPIFNNDRWDYAYTWQKYGKIRKAQNLSLYFSNGRLVKIEKYPDAS